MIERDFGWLPVRLDEVGSGWSVRTLAHFDEAVANVRSSDRVDTEWYWPDIVHAPPLRPVEAYHLPTTHNIAIDIGAGREEEERLGEFLVAVLGFLCGMLLTPDGWVQFNRVSIDPSRWQDFGLKVEARNRILENACRTWIANPQVREALFGVVWWHTYAVAYEHAFERFMAQYQVLDACWSVHEKMHGAKRPGHAARIGELARFYNLRCPESWSVAKENDVISDIRNQIIHEAKWGGATIGFAHPAGPNQSIHLELYWFNSRLILALLGEDSAYVHSKIVFQPYLIK